MVTYDLTYLQLSYLTVAVVAVDAHFCMTKLVEVSTQVAGCPVVSSS